MIELFRDTEMARVGLFQSILESEGIRTFVRNGNVSGTEAAIPVFAPALCILDEKDQARAVELIRSHSQTPEEDGPDRKCRSCGEMNPGNFGVCWNCNNELEAREAQ